MARTVYGEQMMTFDEAVRMFARRAGEASTVDPQKKRIKIAHNTHLVRTILPSGMTWVAVTLYDQVIIEYGPSGRVVYYTTHLSPTTLNRWCRFGPVNAKKLNNRYWLLTDPRRLVADAEDIRTGIEVVPPLTADALRLECIANHNPFDAVKAGVLADAVEEVSGVRPFVPNLYEKGDNV